MNESLCSNKTHKSIHIKEPDLIKDPEIEETTSKHRKTSLDDLKQILLDSDKNIEESCKK